MRYLAFLAAISLTACTSASGPSTTTPGVGEMPSNEILIYRRAEAGVAANVTPAPAILLDGRAIGTCRIAQPILIRLPEGTWTVTALTPNGQVSQDVRVGEGDRVNLRCGTSSVPPLSPAPTLVEVETEVAQKEAGL